MPIDKTMNIYQKELSIQITLSGFSFSLTTPQCTTSGVYESYEFDTVLEPYYALESVVEWSVPQVLIVPFELFDHSSIDHYLSTAAMLNPQSERSMFAVRDSYVAVWAVRDELYDYIDSRLLNAGHTHSLLRVIQSAMESEAKQNSLMVIDIDDALTMHLALRVSEELEYAHSIKIVSAQDVLFYAKRIAQERAVASPSIVMSGSGVESAYILLSRYFTDITIK